MSKGAGSEIVATGGAVEAWEAGPGDALTVENMVAQVQLIERAKEAVMRKDVDYGIVPGTGDKPTLLKPGAEKLLFLFRFRPVIEERDITIIDLEGGHRLYRVLCRVLDRHGAEVATGVGECGTTETRYRYRNENTGRKVPEEYWKARDPQLLGGSTFRPRKVDNKWLVYQQVEHPNPHDYYNTCLKMAKKRALVDASLTSTASSGLFTQDVEDAPELFGGMAVTPPVVPPPTPKPDSEAQKPQAQPAAQAAPVPQPELPAQPQAAPAPAAPQPAPAQRNGDAPAGTGRAMGEVVVTKTKAGGTSEKPWHRYGAKLDDGQWYNSFDDAVGSMLETAKSSKRRIVIEYHESRYGRDIDQVWFADGIQGAAAAIADNDDDTPF